MAKILSRALLPMTTTTLDITRKEKNNGLEIVGEKFRHLPAE